MVRSLICILILCFMADSSAWAVSKTIQSVTSYQQRWIQYSQKVKNKAPLTEDLLQDFVDLMDYYHQYNGGKPRYRDVMIYSKRYLLAFKNTENENTEKNREKREKRRLTLESEYQKVFSKTSVRTARDNLCGHQVVDSLQEVNRSVTRLSPAQQSCNGTSGVISSDLPEEIIKLIQFQTCNFIGTENQNRRDLYKDINKLFLESAESRTHIINSISVKDSRNLILMDRNSYLRWSHSFRDLANGVTSSSDRLLIKIKDQIRYTYRHKDSKCFEFENRNDFKKIISEINRNKPKNDQILVIGSTRYQDEKKSTKLNNYSHKITNKILDTFNWRHLYNKVFRMPERNTMIQGYDLAVETGLEKLVGVDNRGGSLEKISSKEFHRSLRDALKIAEGPLAERSFRQAFDRRTAFIGRKSVRSEDKMKWNEAVLDSFRYQVENKVIATLEEKYKKLESKFCNELNSVQKENLRLQLVELQKEEILHVSLQMEMRDFWEEKHVKNKRRNAKLFLAAAVVVVCIAHPPAFAIPLTAVLGAVGLVGLSPSQFLETIEIFVALFGIKNLPSTFNSVIHSVKTGRAPLDLFKWLGGFISDASLLKLFNGAHLVTKEQLKEHQAAIDDIYAQHENRRVDALLSQPNCRE